MAPTDKGLDEDDEANEYDNGWISGEDLFTDGELDEERKTPATPRLRRCRRKLVPHKKQVMCYSIEHHQRKLPVKIEFLFFLCSAGFLQNFVISKRDLEKS